VVGEEDGMDVDEGMGAGDNGDEWGGIDDGEDGMPEFFKEEAQKSATQTPTKTKSKRKKTRVAELVREKIRKVLEDVTELADQRAGKCDENDFLKLLYAFNQEGIHFA
jgi:18S rRNA (adenine1779-N6/adenine1780-N6)-dimethyltransferase